MKIKQVIVVRTDLNMRKGKMCAQAAHASMEFLRQAMLKSTPGLSVTEYRWLFHDRTKIVLQAPDEETLLALERRANELGIRAHLFRDNGFTEVAPMTATALALGPEEPSVLDPITAGLRLL